MGIGDEVVEMFKVIDIAKGIDVGIFPEAELQQFDTRCFKIEPLHKVEPRPFVLMVHVRQAHYDESGSRFRLTVFNLKPGHMIDGLRITASGHLMKL